MKLIVVGIILVVMSGCIERIKKKPETFDQKKVIAACDRIISDFRTTLKRELIAAMAEGGTENAIYACNLMAPMVADSFSRMAGIDIKRVSLKQRNSTIKPDSFETAALTRFAENRSDDPQFFFEITFDDSSKKVLRYMKEIKIGQVCLKCHGDRADFSQPLVDALNRNYPNDKAIGYRVGDSRGAFSVTVSYPKAKETITHLLTKDGR